MNKLEKTGRLKRVAEDIEQFTCMHSSLLLDAEQDRIPYHGYGIHAAIRMGDEWMYFWITLEDSNEQSMELLDTYQGNTKDEQTLACAISNSPYVHCWASDEDFNNDDMALINGTLYNCMFDFIQQTLTPCPCQCTLINTSDEGDWEDEEIPDGYL